MNDRVISGSILFIMVHLVYPIVPVELLIIPFLPTLRSVLVWATTYNGHLSDPPVKTQSTNLEELSVLKMYAREKKLEIH